MTLPKKPYTISELEALWSGENIDVVQCLENGILKASIKLNPTELICCDQDEAGKETFSDCSVKKGLFEIVNYGNIVWTENINLGLLCDFSECKVRISRDNTIYAFWGLYRDEVTTGYSNRVIRYSDILITAEEVERFKLEIVSSTDTSTDELARPELDHALVRSIFNASSDVSVYLEQNKEKSVAEKVYWLRTNTNLTSDKIGEMLNISHGSPGCKSRKVTVCTLFKKEAIRLGTWEQVKRKKENR